MIGFNRHPSWRDLNRLADDELEIRLRAAALEHVASCPKCTRDLSLLREMREAGREMRHPSPPKDLLDDILRDRTDGVRVILPAVPSSPAGRRRMLPAAAAVAIMTGLVGLATLSLTSEAGAGASELMIDPARPVPGEQVRISYRPATELAGETALRLRLRLRQPDSEPPRGTLGEYDDLMLIPDGDGRYVASFQLPPDFAFANMAVENLSSDRLDDRGGRLWSVRAHAADGSPLPGALRQEFLVLQNRSWPEARDVLHEMTLLYPELAEGWSLQLSYEQASQLPDEAAAALAVHREIFRGMQERAEAGSASPDEVAAMARYAAVLGDAEAQTRWLARLEELAPAHRLVVSRRIASLSEEGAKVVDAYLEALWSTGSREGSVYREGFRGALATGDTKTAGRWALRGLELEEDHLIAAEMALALVAYPETRDRGIGAIHDLLAHLGEEADDERPLHATPSEVHRESLGLQAMLRVQLGRQLQASGEPRVAIRELDAADALGTWSPHLYRTRIEASLAVGDAETALADFHRLDADPVYSRESVDSLRHRLPSISGAELREGRSTAEREMVERTLANQGPRRGLPAAQLQTSTGQLRSLERLLAGQPTILMLWDRRVFSSPGEVADVNRAGHILGDQGQLLWITPEPDSESLQSFNRTAGLTVPVFHDPRAAFATSLGEWGSRAYYVIDEAGMIRARTHSLMEAVRHLEVLRIGSRDTA